MARFNYRQVRERFGHLDATFVKSRCTFPEGSATYEVSLYPWWEHPKLKEAQSENMAWKFVEVPEEAYKSVTVYGTSVFEANLSRRFDVEAWSFTQNNSLLWKYEASSEIICNEPIGLEQWLEVVDHVRTELKLLDSEDIGQFVSIDRIREYGGCTSFSLGTLPLTLFFAIEAQLVARGFDFYAPRKPEKRELPVLFLIDGEDYIVAADFEIDVPEFEHRDEWLQF